MQRFDVLSRHLSVFEKRFLEASAGTGKTFAIEHLVIRLLLEGEAPLPLEEILVVTFTRAATRELRMRIRSNLERILHELHERKGSFDYVQALVEAGDEKVRTAKRRIEDALACFDRAAIFTIHGFCYQMLREFAFEARLDFDLKEPEEGAHKKKLHQVVEDFFRTGLKPPFYSARQVEAVLKKQQGDMTKLIKKLVLLMEKELSLPVSFDKLHKQFEGALQKLPAVETQKFLDDLALLLPHYKRVTGEEVALQSRVLGELLEKRECSQEKFDQMLAHKEWFLEKLTHQNLKVRAALPEASLLHYPGLFEKLRASLLPLLQEARDPERILRQMAHDCQKRFQESETEEQPFSPDEILNKMHRAVEDPAFAQAARKKYRALIVDEFQDTDPIQWQIFETLFVRQKQGVAALYLVGDPKQAIYAFRGADVYTYFRAQEILGEEKRAFLDTNFRSEAPLVDALNLLFSAQVSSEWLTLPAQNRSLPYLSVGVRENKGSSLKDGKSAVHFLLAETKATREKSFPPVSFEEEWLLPFFAKEIERLILEEKLPLSRFAILIKDRYQAERVRQFLEKRNLKSYVKQKRDLSVSGALSAMKDLLEAALLPDDVGLAKRVLAAPIFGEEIQQMQSRKPQEIRKRFRAYNETLKARGFSFFFTQLERSAQDSAFYRDCNQIAELLIEEESYQKASPEALLLFLQELKMREEDLLARPEEVGDAISLLTTHVSKGLEFDIVFALGIASRQTTQEELEESILKEREAEKMRQLYVALTRAKRRVYIPLIFDASEKALPENAAPIELFCRKMSSPFTLAHFITRLEELKIGYTLLTSERILLQEPILSEPEESTHPEIPSLVIPPRFLLSFSSLAHKKESESLSVELAPVKTAHTLPLGAETGTLLHTILEKILRTHLFSKLPRVETMRLITHEVENTLLAGWEEVLFEMLKRALTLPLAPYNFCLQDISPEKIFPEMEFLFPTEDHNLLKGFADLIFEWEGKYFLLDWKSNWLGETNEAYTQENLEKAMQEHDYFLQGAIYAVALERYVKLFDMRPFTTLFGGAFYLFLRAPALFFFRPGSIAY